MLISVRRPPSRSPSAAYGSVLCRCCFLTDWLGGLASCYTLLLGWCVVNTCCCCQTGHQTRDLPCWCCHVQLSWSCLCEYATAVFTARCYASAVLAMGLCLSVSLCLVTSWSSTKTAEHRITQTKPHDSPGTLQFLLTMLVGMVLQSVVSMSICFLFGFWSLTPISCMCMGHDHSLPGIEIRGHRPRVRSVWLRSSIEGSLFSS